MMHLRIFFVVVFFCFGVNAKNQSNLVVASVNNKAITLYDLQDRYNFVTKIMKITPQNPVQKEVLINQMIDKMIDEELIRQESTRVGIESSEDEVVDIIESIMIKKKKSLASFKAEFTRNQVSFESYKNQIKADLLWSKIVSGSLKSRIKITDLEIQEFFEQQKLETDVTKYFIAEIYIPKSENAKILAEKISQELKNGVSFADLVKQFSRSPTSESNGEIGWVSKSDIDSKIFASIHNLHKNSHSNPIFLHDGYYIFKLLDKKSVVEIKDDDINFAKNRIFMQHLQTEGKGYFMDLRRRSFIEVYRDKIDL